MKNLIGFALAIIILIAVGVVFLPITLATAIVYFGLANLALCLGFMFLIAKAENN